jgi:DNA-binding transcriptional ArsR family regulator
MAAEDPLERLLVDAVAIDRERIAAALEGRVGIDRTTSSVVVRPAFSGLSSAQKVLAYLLGRKVAALLEVAGEEATPGEISEQTGMPPGTVRPTLSQLKTERLVTARGGRYLVPGPAVDSAIGRLAEAATESGDGPPAGTPAVRRTTKPTKSRRRPKKARPKKAPSAAKGRAGSRRRTTAGPTTLVQELVDRQFFSEPRTLADVRKRIKDKRGHAIPVTTLSPIFTKLVRDEVLDRDKNNAGVYEYRMHDER